MKKLLTYLKDFYRKDDAMAVLELAVIAPVFIAMFVGGVEFTRYAIFLQKANHSVSVMADYMTQQPEACSNEFMMAAMQAQEPFAKYSTDQAIETKVMSLVSAGDPAGRGQQCARNQSFCLAWQLSTTRGSQSRPSKLLSQGLPNGLRVDNGENYIAVEVSVNYEPMLDISHYFMQTASDTNSRLQQKYSIFRPRAGAMKTLDGSGC